MFVPLKSPIQIKFLKKASPWVDGFVKWSDSWGLLCKARSWSWWSPWVPSDSAYSLSPWCCEDFWRVVACSCQPPHSFSHVFSLRIKHIISGQDVPRPVRFYQWQQNTGHCFTFPLPFFFCLWLVSYKPNGNLHMKVCFSGFLLS